MKARPSGPHGGASLLVNRNDARPRYAGPKDDPLCNIGTPPYSAALFRTIGFWHSASSCGVWRAIATRAVWASLCLRSIHPPPLFLSPNLRPSVVSYRTQQTSFVSGIPPSQTRQDTRAVSRDVRKTTVFLTRHRIRKNPGRLLGTSSHQKEFRGTFPKNIPEEHSRRTSQNTHS